MDDKINFQDSINFQEKFRQDVVLKVIKWRHYRGWTQETLAARAGLSVRQLGDIERMAHCNITLNTLAKLIYALDVPNGQYWQEPPHHK